MFAFSLNVKFINLDSDDLASFTQETATLLPTMPHVNNYFFFHYFYKTL